MIIHKITHKTLRELFTAHGIIKGLESIKLSNISDEETKIICRTLLHSYETLLQRISEDEDAEGDNFDTPKHDTEENKHA